MVAFRVRPRAQRSYRGHIALFRALGTQTTAGVVTPSDPTGALHAIGHQATGGRALAGGALIAVGKQATTAKVTPSLVIRGVQATRGRAGAGGATAFGRQGTRSLVTPAILCLGKQGTRGTVAVGGGSITAWPNGYGYRALVEIPPQPDLSGTVANLVHRLPADVLAAAALKTTGNGGKVQSASGFDIRLEPYGAAVGAGKLDHQFVTPYSPTAGAVDLRFRVVVPGASPAWDVTTPYRLWLYVGKAGLAATEENPTGLWQGATRATRYDTGADLTGNGRAFTTTGVVATTLAGMPAGTMGSTSKLSRTLVAAEVGLQNLAALTSEFVFQLASPVPTTADGSLDRVGGTAQGTARFSTWMFTTLEFQGGANWFSGGAQHNCDAATADNVVDASLTHLFCVRQSGAAPQLWRGETQLATTTNNPPTTGSINVQAGDVHELGASSGARNDTTPGVYGLYVLWPAALSAAFMAMRTRSELQGRSVAGMGAFDAFGDTDQSPVAVPWRTTNDGTQTLYNVVPKAFDPDSDPITLTAVGSSTHAGDTASLSGGQVQYKPQPSWPGGLAEVPFTIGDGRGKASSSRLWLAVTPSLVVVGNEGLAPSFPTAAQSTVIGPIALSALQGQYNTLAATQIANGVTILVTPGGSMTGDLTLAKSAPAGKPIVIRVGTLNAGGQIVDPPAFPAGTVAGGLALTGDNNWVRGLTFNKGGYHAAGATGNRVNRCKLTGSTSISPANFFQDAGVGLSFDWSEIANYFAVGLQLRPALGCRNAFIYRTWIHDQAVNPPASGTQLMVGSGEKDDFTGTAMPVTPIRSNITIRDCLCTSSGTASEAFEVKSSFVTLERCTTAAGGGKVNLRHGHFNKLLACHAGPSLMGDRGEGNTYADCVATGSALIGPLQGSQTYDVWIGKCLAGTKTASDYPNSQNAVMVRCQSIDIGHDAGINYTRGPPTAPSGWVLWSCGPPTYDGVASAGDGTIHATGFPTGFGPRGDSGPVIWRSAVTAGGPAQVGPSGVYDPADGGT